MKKKPKTWKPKSGVSWRQKLEKEHPGHGKLVPLPPLMRKKLGNGTLLIPRPLDADALVRKIKKGKVLTSSQLRAQLAAHAAAKAACPLCTGIFLRIVAEAAEEDRRAGKTRIAPYWRVIKDDGGLNEKFPGGSAAQADKLRDEGFDVQMVGRGKALKVSNLLRQ